MEPTYYSPAPRGWLWSQQPSLNARIPALLKLGFKLNFLHRWIGFKPFNIRVVKKSAHFLSFRWRCQRLSPFYLFIVYPRHTLLPNDASETPPNCPLVEDTLLVF